MDDFRTDERVTAASCSLLTKLSQLPSLRRLAIQEGAPAILNVPL